MPHTITRKRHFSFRAIGLAALLTSLCLGCGDESLEPALDLVPPLANRESPVCKENKALAGSSVTADGYTLVSVFKDDGLLHRTELIDMKGQVIKTWPLKGYPALMRPDGSVLGHVNHEVKNGKPVSSSIVRMSWEGKQIWNSGSWKASKNADRFSRQHHDIQQSPNPVGHFTPGSKYNNNGDFLVLSDEDIVAPAVSDQRILDDVIYEYKADGSETGFVWKASDHIDEMGFSVAERADIKKNYNVDSSGVAGDWLHLNSMATLGRNKWYEDVGDPRFHPDNILISSRHAKFLAIISKKTGRLVWRVGPDFNKPKPEHELGEIIGQHHAHIIPYGLPGAGNVLIFDNGGMAGYGENRSIRTYSRVLEFNPVTLKKVWEYKGDEFKDGFLSVAMGGAQRLPNGNTLVSMGSEGMLLEVNSAGKSIWSYTTKPDADGTENYIYRAYRVPPEWLPAGINPDGYPLWKKRFNCPQ